MNWKKFERLVAAIHHSESKGAEVKWNENIKGRQFDVTLRFKFGLHCYLTVIECKNYSRKVTVEKIDAFATKYKDVNANKAIMISSNGYQSGCFTVALKHGIRLLTLSENTESDMNKIINNFIPALNIYDVKLVTSNGGKEYLFEDIGGRLSYLMKKTRLNINEMEVTPKD